MNTDTNTETVIDIEKLLPWSAPVLKETSRGPRMLRTAKVPTGGVDDPFWLTWRAHKVALKEAGLSCKPGRDRNDPWEVCWWTAPDPGTVAERKADVAESITKSRAMDSKLEVPCPAGLAYRGYQKAGISYALECWTDGLPGCLNGDEMGLGKTIQGIGVMNYLGAELGKVIIVCPNTLKYQWRDECRKWLTDKRRVMVQNAGCPWLGELADVLIINYDIVERYRKDIDAETWGLRIVDEAHYCKNPKAKRSKATLGIAAKRKLLFTGTPLENRTKELYPLLHDCDPKRWPEKGFFKFGLRYCDGKSMTVPVKKKVMEGGRWTGRYDKKMQRVWDFDGSSNSAELQQVLRGSIMVRRLKCDVLTELPPKRRQVVELPNDDFEHLLEEEREFLEARRERIEELQAACVLAKASDNEEEYFAAVAALSEGQQVLFEETTKMRHAIALAKLPQCLEFVDNALESSTGKVIIFAHHLDVVDLIVRHFGRENVGLVIGGVKPEQRMEEVRRFQTDPKVRVFIGNDAAAEGLNLTAADHVVFFEQDWRPGKINQKEDRAHRMGQKGSVLITQLVMEGSIDGNMMKTVVAKMDVADRVLDRMGETEVSDEVIASQMSEPDFVQTGAVRTVRISRAEVIENAPRCSRALCELAHRGVQSIAGMCDGAVQHDDMGFAGPDVRIGHSFANQLFLSPKQAVIAVRLCVKYRRQLGALSDQVREMADKEGVVWKRAKVG